MKRLVLFILLILSVIIQTAVMPNFSYWGIFPNILLIIIISFSLSGNFLEAAIWSIIGGFTIDLFSAKSFGLSAIGFIVAVAVIYLVSSSLEFGKVYSKIILAISSSLAYFISIILCSLLFDFIRISDNLLHLNWRLGLIVLVSTAINVIIIVLISPFITLFNDWLIKVEKRLETKML